MKTIKLLFFTFLFTNLTSGQCWTTVDTSGSSTIGLQANGSLWGWGLYGTGLLGLGLGIENSQTIFPLTQIGSETDWSANYSVGINHALAIKNNGLLFAWGNNERGQSGNGTSGSQNFILAPQEIGTDTWKAVVAGNFYSLGIKTDGSLWAWGLNDKGQLGTGNVTWQNAPTQVGNDINWDKVYSGNTVSYAIKTDGTLWSWGGGGDSVALGFTQNANDYLTPHQVGNTNNWVTLAPYFAHVIGLRSDGTIWGWGRNIDEFNAPYYGNGIPDNNIYENNPTQIGSDANWYDITVANQNFFATKNNGTLWGWGRNTTGILGDGTNITRYTPIQLGTDSDWIFVDAGQDVGNQFYGVKSNNSLYRWGTPNSTPTVQGNMCNLSTTSFESLSILASPNPTTNYINLTSEVPFVANTEIIISNIVGQNIKIIRNPTIISETIMVDFTGFEKGLYLLEVKSKEKKEIIKILKN